MNERQGLYDRIVLAVPFLSRLQDWVIRLGGHRLALPWLMGLSFLESIIFPVPVDPLLAGLVLARPQNFIRLGVLTALASTLGGVVGWAIGLWLGQAVIDMGWIGQEGAFADVAAAFARHGWLLLLIGAFTPLPYKVVVVSSGFLGIGVIPLIITSMIGRTSRFVLIAALVRYRQDTGKAMAILSFLVILFAFFWWYVKS